MANHYRGEIDAVLGGKTYTLCLTLGALAEMESAFGKKDLVELAERFSQGRISANEAITILRLGLKGGGYEISSEEVGTLSIERGAAGAIKLVSQLLAATFGVDEQDNSNIFDASASTSSNSFDAHASKEGEAPRP